MKIQIALAKGEAFNHDMKQFDKMTGKIDKVDKEIDLINAITKLRKKLKEAQVDTNKAVSRVPKGPQQAAHRAAKKKEGESKKAGIQRQIEALQKKRKTTQSLTQLTKIRDGHQATRMGHQERQKNKYRVVGLVGGLAYLGTKALLAPSASPVAGGGGTFDGGGASGDW